jgi:hypothetical protein
MIDDLAAWRFYSQNSKALRLQDGKIHRPAVELGKMPVGKVR